MSPTRGTVVLVGASRGIGAAVAEHLEPMTRRLIAISRTPPPVGEWLRADMAGDAGIDAVVAAVGDSPLDALLYLGGVWEEGAFTSAYRFSDSPSAETRFVIDVNLVAPILLVQKLLPALERAGDAKVVLMGSVTGRDNDASVEVANSASKFGLRGAAQALALSLGPLGIGVSVINPANVATPEVLTDIVEGRTAEQEAIPLDDIVRTVDYVLAASPAAIPSEIDIVQRRPVR